MEILPTQQTIVTNFKTLNYMKQALKILLAIILFTNSSCCAQKLMKTVADASKLKENKIRFINKPLKLLLKEIQPEIKMVSANPSKNSQSRLGYFIFRFVEPKENDSLNTKQIFPVQITVFVKEPFEWDISKRDTEKKQLWTKKDRINYGNLTVLDIRIFGNN